MSRAGFFDQPLVLGVGAGGVGGAGRGCRDGRREGGGGTGIHLQSNCKRRKVSPAICAEFVLARTRFDMRSTFLAVLFISATTLGGCSEGVLDPQGPIASAERQILFNSLGIMLAIVTPTIFATLGVAYWFRSSNTRALYMPDFTYSGRLELIVWSIPAMTVLLVGGVAWVGAHDLDPRRAIASAVKPVTVQVVSLDWKWLFIYPDQGVASVNRLTIPVGTPIAFELISSGVMNSFFVPQLGSQIYAMAGMATHLQLQADRPGAEAPAIDQAVPARQPQAVMSMQFFRRTRRAATRDVGRRCAYDLPRGRDLTRNHGGIAGQPDPENQVAMIGFVFETDAREDEMGIESGMFRRECGQKRSDVLAAEIGGCSDPE
jgi:cytochrome o ubiquinol oxidase subunit II